MPVDANTRCLLDLYVDQLAAEYAGVSDVRFERHLELDGVLHRHRHKHGVRLFGSGLRQRQISQERFHFSSTTDVTQSCPDGFRSDNRHVLYYFRVAASQRRKRAELWRDLVGYYRRGSAADKPTDYQRLCLKPNGDIWFRRQQWLQSGSQHQQLCRRRDDLERDNRRNQRSSLEL